MTCGDEAIPGQCPVVHLSALHVEWATWWPVHMWWPFVAQLALSLLFLLILHPLYVEAYYRTGWFQIFVKRYVGTPESPKVTRPLPRVVLCSLQCVCSAVEVVIWVMRTYAHSAIHNRLMLACTFFDVVSWFVDRIRHGCKVQKVWDMEAIVDMLTIVPMLLGAFLPQLEPEGYDDWLTLHFLRAYSILHNFERARTVAQLDKHTAAWAQALTQLILRVVALMVVMAGAVLTFEVLGDPLWMSDSFMETHAGDTMSFMQMVYWIVVSITTVGYGDFAPSTVIARMMTCVFIVVGFASIYFIQYSFAEMVREQYEGTGHYSQRSWGAQRHVAVVLCHQGNASRMATFIHGFLQELLHASHNETEDHHDHASSIWSHRCKGLAQRFLGTNRCDGSAMCQTGRSQGSHRNRRATL